LEYNLFIHRAEDYAGVAVAGIRAGDRIRGLVVADGSRIELDALQDVALAHKVAVRAAAPGEHLILYGHPAGEATQPIRPGDHVHVHNMKSLRWT
jgi:(2R)-sulfolactate sulfo-lyase subunit alpha